MMRRALTAFAFVVLAFGAANAQPPRAQTPSVKLVFFTADWCPNCKVMAPRLDAAMRQMSGVQRIDIDITDSARWDASLERALDGGVVRLYNAYVGTTGFAVFAATDTGETLGCVTRVHDATVIATLAERAKQRVATSPPHQRAPSRDLSCPAERPQPPR